MAETLLTVAELATKRWDGDRLEEQVNISN
jgi:hypothetical protein